ncbi:NgoMIV family type II restriction endonuclease, partial [Mitsuokella jalaludinii]
YELVDTVNELAAETPAAEDTQQLLQTLIEGKRLKDISDLPLDLGV